MNNNSRVAKRLNVVTQKVGSSNLLIATCKSTTDTPALITKGGKMQQISIMRKQILSDITKIYCKYKPINMN